MTELPTLNVVYMGMGTLTGGKQCVLLIPLALLRKQKSYDAAKQQASAFTLKRGVTPKAIGAVYNIPGELNVDGTISTIKGRFEYNSELSGAVDSDMVLAMQAEHRAREITRRADKEEKEFGRDKEMLRALEVLRRRYRSTDKLGKLALEVLLLDALRNPGF